MEGFFMSKEPKDATQKPNDPTARRETTREVYRREAAANPRFKEVTNSGKGFVIIGARPPAVKPDDAQPSETPRYIATVPTEPTFMIIDPDRPTVPAPVPMGPYRKETEQLIANCMATYPALTREKTIVALWLAGGI
jgi:hypothetical protein